MLAMVSRLLVYYFMEIKFRGFRGFCPNPRNFSKKRRTLLISEIFEGEEQSFIAKIKKNRVKRFSKISLHNTRKTLTHIIIQISKI